MHVRAFQRRKEKATRQLRDVRWARVWEEEPEEGKNWEAWSTLAELSFF